MTWLLAGCVVALILVLCALADEMVGPMNALGRH